jgi:hypothetical protein
LTSDEQISMQKHKKYVKRKKTRWKDTFKINNPAIKDLNDSEVDETANNELRKMMIKIINKIKEDMHIHLSEFKENTNKHLNEFKRGY